MTYYNALPLPEELELMIFKIADVAVHKDKLNECFKEMRYKLETGANDFEFLEQFEDYPYVSSQDPAYGVAGYLQCLAIFDIKECIQVKWNHRYYNAEASRKYNRPLTTWLLADIF